MGDAKLKCARCGLRAVAARMAWVTAQGWCCIEHRQETHERVLIEFYTWCLSRGGGRPVAHTNHERHALYIAGVGGSPDPPRPPPGLSGVHDRGAEWMEYRGEEE